MIELKRDSLTLDKQRERDRRCRQLSNDIDDIKRSIHRFNADRARKLREANRLRAQAKALADREFRNQKISFLFNAVGAAISGGSASLVGRAVGNVIGTIGSIFGFTSIGQQINRMLEEIKKLMSEFEILGGQVDHLTSGMARMAKTRRELCGRN